MGDQIKYPLGKAETITATAAATVAVSINNQKTKLKFSAALAADMTLNLTVGGNVEEGAELTIVALSDGTARDITLGTGMSGPVFAGVISKTRVTKYEYWGGAFSPVSAALTLD